MDNHTPEIEELIKQFSKLPGLGPKSAKRIILKLINNKENMITVIVDIWLNFFYFLFDYRQDKFSHHKFQIELWTFQKQIQE